MIENMNLSKINLSSVNYVRQVISPCYSNKQLHQWEMICPYFTSG